MAEAVVDRMCSIAGNDVAAECRRSTSNKVSGYSWTHFGLGELIVVSDRWAGGSQAAVGGFRCVAAIAGE